MLFLYALFCNGNIKIKIDLKICFPKLALGKWGSSYNQNRLIFGLIRYVLNVLLVK